MSKKSRKVRVLKNTNNSVVVSSSSLDEVLHKERLLQIEKGQALNNAFASKNIVDILKAQDYIKTIEKREDINIKSFIVDPLQQASSFGYQDKPYSLSYDMLRAMGKTHIVKSIIATRKSQVLKFCEPQKDKYSQGFVIDKRNKWRASVKEKTLTAPEEKKREDITNFILNCGTTQNFWHGDTFESFISKILNDSLELDQACFEVVRDRAGRPIEFFSTDGATYRIADANPKKNAANKDNVVNGYTPAYVQVYQGRPVAEFYPWELGFGVRNPSTDIRTNGYGKSELEDMIAIITSLLNSDAYNANFFKVGSAPQGIIKYSGNINQNTVDDFRVQWQAQMSGLNGAHKTPIINADKMDYISTHVPNKDMEFSKFQEFLIKIGCAQYLIDPSEIGFNMNGASDSNNTGMGGDNTKEKLQYSKDKGLKPLLKSLQYWINKYIVWQLDPEFELRFTGVDDEEDKNQELEADIKLVGNLLTLNEVRAKRNYDPIENGDIVLNPAYLQGIGMVQQGQQESNDYVDQQEETNPFKKSLSDDLSKILSQ